MTTTTKEIVPQGPEALAGLSIAEFRSNRQLIVSCMEAEMKQGVDYGVTPGTSGKPALWKPGAEKLCSLFAFAPKFSYLTERTEGGHRTYDVKCTLTHRGSGTFLGDADACCSTLETKYASRRGASDDAPRIPNNPADYYNTCLKMGEKRAIVATVLFTTAASDIFSQDYDDEDEEKPKGANAGARAAGGASVGATRGVDTRQGGPGLWTGTMGTVSQKTFKKKDGTEGVVYRLSLEDGRQVSTFDDVIAGIARGAKGKTVQINTVAGKKAGYLDLQSFEEISVSGPAPKKEEPPPPAAPAAKAEQDPDLVPEPDDIPF